MFDNVNIRNIGIFAHVDAGKTTLTENILYVCKSIRKIGRVDEGTAHTDNMQIERERGISVRAAAASVIWRGMRINIIDTPGHVDFSAEVERSVLALDGAVLVVSAVEGVQAQTETIFQTLKQMKIPAVIFINKIDRLGADITGVTEQLSIMTGSRSLPVEDVCFDDEDGCRIIGFKDNMKADIKEKICEFLSEYDDAILEKVIADKNILFDTIQNTVSKLSRSGAIYPIFFGTALKGIGIENVLDGIVDYLPQPLITGQEAPAGIAYKIYNGMTGGKAVHVRLYEGSVKVRGTIYNYTRDMEEKVTGIFKTNGSGYEPSDSINAGEIGILYGLNNTKSGDILGSPQTVRKKPSITSPTLTVQVYPRFAGQLDNVVEAFRILDEEDPLLNVQWLDDQRELHVQLMGMIQMEILTKIVKDRFRLDVVFEKPTVVYKETPKTEGTGCIQMKTPYLAALEMKVAPLERGRGYVYESLFPVDFIFQRFQNEVEETVPYALKEGLYGWEVTDIKVNLVGGRSINLATKPSDFRAVTPIAVMRAIKDAGTVILEPMLHFEVNFDRDEAGVFIKDLLSMRAEIVDQAIIGDSCIIRGIIPQATSLEYPLKAASMSKGKSSFKTSFAEYRECSFEFARIRQRKTADPLDMERYLQSISRKNTRDRQAGKNRE